MSDTKTIVSGAATPPGGAAARTRRDGGGAIEIERRAEELYAQHLWLDNVADPDAADGRQRYEALGHAVRDVLAERWVRTDQTDVRTNPKRIYYLIWHVGPYPVS
jgi:hypothetical protein